MIYLHNYAWEHDNLRCCGVLQILKDQGDLLLDQIGILKLDKFDKYVRDLQDVLIAEWDPTYKAAIDDAIRKLTSPGVMTESDLAGIQATLEGRLGAAYAAKIGEPLYEFHFQSYKTGQEQILQATASFNLIDQKALRVLNQHNIYWVGENYGNNLYDSVQRIGTEIISQGLSKTEAGALFEKELADQFQKYGSQYWEGFANHVVTRSREMGRIEGYVKAGIVRYEIVAVLDEHTSAICWEMNGRVFEVEKAVGLRDAIINARSPEEVKNIAPWRKPEEIAAAAGIENMQDVATEDLPPGMELPPYHFRCRTRTVIYEE